MNSEQAKSILRQIMIFVGGIIAGSSLVSKFFTPDQVVSILTSDTVINTLVGLASAGFASAWGYISRSDKNLVATVDALPGVQGVITKSNTEGLKLANDVPSETVVPAATPAADKVAKAA